MIHDLLCPDNPSINHKRIYRLYSGARLAGQRKAKVKRYGVRVPLIQAETLNQTWSMDFVSDSLSTRRRLTFLTLADDFLHECVQIAADFGMGAHYVNVYSMRWRCFAATQRRCEQTTGRSSPLARFWPGPSSERSNTS
jgi:hypothetical protein